MALQKKQQNGKEPTPKEGDKLPTDQYASQKKTGEGPGKSGSCQKVMTNLMSLSSSFNILNDNKMAV